MKFEGTEKNFNKSYLLLVNFIYYINQKCCMTIFRMGKTKEILIISLQSGNSD